MARYIGATCRIARRLQKDLEFKTRSVESKCKFKVAPGQHGAKKKRESNYGMQLAAKQALKMKYGLLERQFRRFYHEASRQKGATGVVLLQLLESRLDNLVYRMGFANTRREARQLVSHGAILVNGRCVTVASYIVKPNDQISIRERCRTQVRIVDALKMAHDKGVPEWVDVNAKDMHGTYKHVPDRSDLPSDINEQFVVELYSK